MIILSSTPFFIGMIIIIVCSSFIYFYLRRDGTAAGLRRELQGGGVGGEPVPEHPWVRCNQPDRAATDSAGGHADQGRGGGSVAWLEILAPDGSSAAREGERSGILAGRSGLFAGKPAPTTHRWAPRSMSGPARNAPRGRRSICQTPQELRRTQRNCGPWNPIHIARCSATLAPTRLEKRSKGDS